MTAPLELSPNRIQAGRCVNAEVSVPLRKLAVMPSRRTEPKREKEKAKRVRGQGHLYERGNVYWFELNYKGSRFRQSLDVPATGKTADLTAALDKMTVAIASIRSGEQPRKFEPITVESMFDIWIAEVERTCKPRTKEDYESRWNNHLKPVFGNLFATHVTKDKVSAYLSKRMREGAGQITQNRENRVLQMIFNHNRNKISANNFPEFPHFHSEKNHVRKGRLSDADYETLQGRLQDEKLFWLKVFLTMTFKYGFRKGELKNAKVGYFDSDKSVFTLPAFTTKNKQEREVTIKRDGEIYQMLLKLTTGRPPDDALFTRNGRPVRDFRGAWAKLTLGITNGRGGHVTIHDLRRSAITAMTNKGIGAEQAGTHLSPDVFRRYVSQSEEEQQQIASRIEED